MKKFLLSLCWRGFTEFRWYGYHQKYHREWVLGHSRTLGASFGRWHVSHVESSLSIGP